MRTWKFQIVSVLLLLVTSAQAQQKFVILPARLATRIAKQGTWQPTKADIDGVEAPSQVSKLKAENWKSPAIRIDHPETYFRQYIAILRDGKRRIYVNAFCDEESLSYWRDRLVVVDDGATCYWQALYDPATKKIFRITINSRA